MLNGAFAHIVRHLSLPFVMKYAHVLTERAFVRVCVFGEMLLTLMLMLMLMLPAVGSAAAARPDAYGLHGHHSHCPSITKCSHYTIYA